MSGVANVSGTTLKQQGLILILFWFACVAELGWGSWTGIRIKPAFIELAMVMICLFSNPPTIVFWSGMAGFLRGLLYGESLIVCVGVFATIGLFAAWKQPTEVKRMSVTPLAIRSLSILAAVRLGSTALHRLPAFEPSVIFEIQNLATIACTFFPTLFLCATLAIRQRRIMLAS